MFHCVGKITNYKLKIKGQKTNNKIEKNHKNLKNKENFNTEISNF
jgi:hypothetical protein